MLVVVVGFMCSVLVAVVALVLMLTTGGTETTAKAPGAAPPAPPTAPNTGGSVVQPKPGNKLPASCKMTGDVFSSRPAVAGGIRKQGVRATYHFYSPEYNTSSLACADIVWKWPNYSQKMLQYPWTAYCIGGRAGWNAAKMCGKCLRVKNRATGAAIIVRVADSGGCSGGAKDGLDLDSACAFNAIDTNGHGVRDGHLMVDVEEVEC